MQVAEPGRFAKLGDGNHSFLENKTDIWELFIQREKLKKKFNKFHSNLMQNIELVCNGLHVS